MAQVLLLPLLLSLRLQDGLGVDVLSVKPGVQLGALQPQMNFAAVIVDQVYEDHGIPECVITSGEDGEHSTTSLHYDGRALDFRTRDIPIAARHVILVEIRKRLGEEYDVVLERTHLHVEYDPPTVATSAA